MKNKIQNWTSLAVLALVLTTSTWASAQSTTETRTTQSTTIVPAGQSFTMGSSDSVPIEKPVTPKEKAKIQSMLCQPGERTDKPATKVKAPTDQESKVTVKAPTE